MADALRASAAPPASQPVQASENQNNGNQGIVATTQSSAAASRPASSDQADTIIPPLPEGVAALKFGEIFKPIGRRGLEYAEEALALRGKRVRMLGYLVRHGAPEWGYFRLAPVAITLNDKEYGQADDLPPTTVYVHMPTGKKTVAAHVPGLVLVTGVLELDGKAEADGRRSWIRLQLERFGDVVPLHIAPGPGPTSAPASHAPATEDRVITVTQEPATRTAPVDQRP